jgi:hypothetical protein
MTTCGPRAVAAPKVASLSHIVGQAKALSGDEWTRIRSWPLESELLFPAEKLKG